MMMTRQHLIFAFLLTVALAVAPRAGHAFRNLKAGDEVPNMQLTTLKGKAASVLDKNAKANVFVFFRPHQEHSRKTLKILADLCNAFKKRRVHCVAVVSDYYGKKLILEEVKDTGWSGANVLIDKEDKYYGKLGVYLHPSVGIAGAFYKLVAYEPFTNINYFERLKANIRYALNELDEKQLKLALNPPLQNQEGSMNPGYVNLNFARKLFQSGKLDAALEQALKAANKNEGLAEAHALVGLIYAQKKECDKATPELDRALALDKNSVIAKKGTAICKQLKK